jgi:hypothetical protein
MHFMPVLDLVGQRFGRLKVTELLQERKNGSAVWLCRCKCGREVKVPAFHLRQCGQQTCSVRCPHYRKQKSKAYKAAYQVQEVHEDDEGIWYARRLAAKYLGVNPNTLTIWRHRCAWLNGAALHTKRLADGLGRQTCYYLKTARGHLQALKVSMDDLRAARASRVPTPDYPELAHVESALKELGVTDTVLYDAMSTAGRRTQHRRGKRTVRLKSGGSYSAPCQRSYLAREIVSTLQRDRHVVVPSGKITVKEAARILSVQRGGVNSLIRAGLLEVTPGKVMVTPNRKGYKDTIYAHRCNLIDKDRVNLLKNALAKIPVEFEHAKRPGRPPGRLHLAAEWLTTAGSHTEAIGGEVGTMPAAESRSAGSQRIKLNVPEPYMEKMNQIHDAVLETHQTARETQQTTELIHRRITESSIIPLGPTDARGRWLYDQRCNGVSWKKIIGELASIAGEKGWEVLESEPAACSALSRWCVKHGKNFPRK